MRIAVWRWDLAPRPDWLRQIEGHDSMRPFPEVVRSAIPCPENRYLCWTCRFTPAPILTAGSRGVSPKRCKTTPSLAPASCPSLSLSARHYLKPVDTTPLWLQAKFAHTTPPGNFMGKPPGQSQIEDFTRCCCQRPIVLGSQPYAAIFSVGPNFRGRLMAERCID